MKESDVVRCQIQEWYPCFRRVSLRTVIQVLPETFVDYLLEDRLFLSRSSEAMPTRTVVTCPQLQSEDYDHWSEEDDDEGEPEIPTFPDLERDIKACIEKLGGAVFPKLNWSAPKDTTWISSTGNLQCKNFGEIMLLLKASDNVSHDLCHAFDCCDDKTRERPEVVVLALRKWYDLRPELEFRAFVFGRVLVGISQREVTGFYPSLLGNEDKFELAIAEFFHENIREKFKSDNYTFDCYVTKEWTVKLLDFNPWAGSTLPLLFSWEELEENYTRVSAQIASVSARMLKSTDATNIAEDLSEVTLGHSSALGLSAGRRTTSNSNVEDTNDTGVTSTDSLDVLDSPVKEDGLAGHEDYRVDMRIVTSEGVVQPGMRIATGVPYDFADSRNWEGVIRREATEEAQREKTAAGA